MVYVDVHFITKVQILLVMQVFPNLMIVIKISRIYTCAI